VAVAIAAIAVAVKVNGALMLAAAGDADSAQLGVSQIIESFHHETILLQVSDHVNT